MQWGSRLDGQQQIVSYGVGQSNERLLRDDLIACYLILIIAGAL